MRRLGSLLILFSIVVEARHDTSRCGTTRESPGEALFLHRQATRVRRARSAAQAAAPQANDRDIGNIAVLEDSGGIVEKLNQFNLDKSTVTFTPTAPDAARYRFAVSGLGYDDSAASQGAPVAALGDDDAREIPLPFAFRYFGATYRSVWINSDGNLTFGAAESASSSRLTGRVTGGPQRIAPLFDDLDPSRAPGGVRTWSDASHLIVSWVSVPEYSQFATGTAQTFQVKLDADGRIAFAYNGVSPSSAVVGIAPGNARRTTAIVSFRNDPSGEYDAAVVERFGNTQEIDIVLAAQRFYQTHGDAYNYLVMYNAGFVNGGIGAGNNALAYESTVRSGGSGWGVEPMDAGLQYGSPSRLQAVLNMGPLGQYPTDPNGHLVARGASNDTPLTVLGHEAGHLFLANASIADPEDGNLRPMLGFGGVHWSFVFNSEASLGEGEQILDRGDSASPRFLTAAVTQQYSPLDQYLMGFRPPSDVPDTFVVTGYNRQRVDPTWHPAGGVAFDGTALPVTVTRLVSEEGRRTPDSTVAQRHYRFGFVLIVPAGSQASQSDLEQLEAYRSRFAEFYANAAGGNASAATTLNRSLKLSTFPAAGVLAGGTAAATLSVETAPPADLSVHLDTPLGFAQAPATVFIPAGSTSTTFRIAGVKSGVEELTATPADATYETARARVQVAGASQARFRVVDPAPSSLTVRLSDINDLPYPGAAVTATASAGSAVTPARTLTDDRGLATFRWDYGAAPSAQLDLAAESLPAVSLTLHAGSATPAIASAVNAASFAVGIAPGSIATIFGTNLGPAAKVTVNGLPTTVFYADTKQINFYVPPVVPLGKVTIAAQLPSGAATIDVPLVSEQAGIFAIVPRPGYLEIYATGLGATRMMAGLAVTNQSPTIYFGSTPASPLFSGLAPGYLGLYQVNVPVPPGVSGAVPVVLSIGRSASNAVEVTLP